MNYPSSPYCPCSSGESSVERAKCGCEDRTTKDYLMKQIQQTQFAAYDLQLYLDTHPDCTEALELYTKLNATARSLRQDYENAYGPLKAAHSACDTPFAWNDKDYPWPWAKEREV